MAAVTISEVDKYYNQQCILADINLAVEKGEFVAVIGPSGSGKSTILRLVAGLETVTRGRILINNLCVNKIPAAKRDMAMVFQNYALYPHMTVYDNMAYGLKMRGFKKNVINQRVNEVADMLQLGDYLLRKPQALSGGQRQRVAMGRAIIRSPAVFLFDEPLSNLDAKLKAEMRLEIKKLHKKLNTTCLYVTHDQTEAMTLASRIVVVNKGKIVQIDSPQSLYSQPASIFVAKFIGHYPMNFIPARVMKNDNIIVTELGLTLPMPKFIHPLENAAEVIIGVRPEHVSLTTTAEPDAISIQIDFIDNMGADKLIHASSGKKQQFTVRAGADQEIPANAAIKFLLNKANLFDKKTGLRIGEWNA